MLSWAAATTGAFSLTPRYAAGLQQNILDHEEELKTSGELGFRRATEVVSPVPARPIGLINRTVLGMGGECPFQGSELVFETMAPVFTQEECAAIRAEAEELIGGGISSTFTMTDTNRDCAVHDLPRTLQWLDDGGLARIASLVAHCFPSAVESAESLWVYRGLVINYDSAAGLTHQPIHRDGALVSCVLPLSELGDYDGGGTYIEPLGRAVRVAQGHALLHPSSVRHAGHRISRGERWVLVLFMNTVEMCAGEHGRRFRARAQELFAESMDEDEDEEEEEEEEEEEQGEEDDEEDEEDLELECLLHALHATDEEDHEVFYDLGARAHDLGDRKAALEFYEKALALNPDDPLLLSNKGVAHLELGSPKLAFRCYRNALKTDPHNVNARFNAGELLLELGKLQGLRMLLSSAPEDAMQDEALIGLAKELNTDG